MRDAGSFFSKMTVVTDQHDGVTGGNAKHGDTFIGETLVRQASSRDGIPGSQQGCGALQPPTPITISGAIVKLCVTDLGVVLKTILGFSWLKARVATETSALQRSTGYYGMIQSGRDQHGRPKQPEHSVHQYDWCSVLAMISSCSA